jgi:hypothetical protein
MTIKQVSYNIEIDSDEKTIKDLKLVLQTSHGFNSELTSLLFNGVKLDDNKKIKDYNIKEGYVIIIIVKKPEKTQEQTKIDITNEQKINENGKPNQNTNIDINMNNVDKDLKINAGIIKIRCFKNPEHITKMLDRIKRKNFRLFTKMKENEELFKNLLTQKITQEDIDNYNKYYARKRNERNIGINLTREELEAVKRLKNLGNFTQADVIQAYLACDKNEELTANFLFEQKMRDDEEKSKNQNNTNINNNDKK